MSFEIRCSVTEYSALCREFVDAVAAVEGLQSKLWLLDEERRTAGGVYVFANRATAEAYVGGPIVTALREMPQITALAVEVTGIQTELSEQTGHRFAEADQATEPAAEPDPTEAFAGRVVADLSAAMSGVMVNVGHKLGLYRALAQAGPVTSTELADLTGTHERYVREWLNHQRSCGYVAYDTRAGTYALPDSGQLVLATPESPVFLPPAFDVAATIWADEDKLTEAFRTGRGIGWHEHDHRLFCGTESFFRPSYRTFLTTSWIPALQGVQQRLSRGGSVVDVGCGHGASTIVMAQAFPASRFLGIDSHQESVEVARQRAAEAGVADRVWFECASATDYPGSNYDLICFMDAFHDLGDPVGAARHAERVLSRDGAVMMVEPLAAERGEDNVGPVASLYYAASTAICTPNAMCHSGGLALGAQAGPKQLKEALAAGGINRFRVATQTPFNLVVEARR